VPVSFLSKSITSVCLLSRIADKFSLRKCLLGAVCFSYIARGAVSLLPNPAIGQLGGPAAAAVISSLFASARVRSEAAIQEGPLAELASAPARARAPAPAPAPSTRCHHEFNPPWPV